MTLDEARVEHRYCQICGGGMVLKEWNTYNYDRKTGRSKIISTHRWWHCPKSSVKDLGEYCIRDYDPHDVVVLEV